MSIRQFTAAAIIAASSIVATTTHAQPINDSFVYQGTLNDNGAPANGLYDISFFIYDAEVGGGVPADGFTTVFNVQVIDGLFSCEVDFGVSGQLFDINQTHWLELRVSEAGQPGTTILAPRQKLVPATLANYALRAGHAESANYAEDSGTTLNDAYRNENTILFQDTFGPLNLVATPAQSPVINMRTNLGDDRISMGFGEFSGSSYFHLYGNNDTRVLYAERDASVGGGGFVSVTRNDNGATGIFLDGNYFGTESPRIAMFGTAGTILLEPGQVDNESVVLPSNAISSTELLNETGAAESATGVETALTDDSSTVDTINSVTINAPTSGFVLVLASAEFSINHDGTFTPTFNVGVSDAPNSFEFNTDLEFRLDPDLPAGQYDFPYSGHALFPVSQGANTFYFNASDNSTGGATASVFDRQLSAIYIPTSYGALALNAEPNIPDEYTQSVPPMNHYDILAEQNAALQADNERQQRELDEMREMMEEIKREMQREQQLQSRD